MGGRPESEMWREQEPGGEEEEGSEEVTTQTIKHIIITGPDYKAWLTDLVSKLATQPTEYKA
jgi:hypothetical protein